MSLSTSDLCEARPTCEFSASELPTLPATGCSCLEHGPREFRENFLGIDSAHGRSGEVMLRKCLECGQTWLCYQVEYEGIVGSARWYAGPVTREQANAATPEGAVDELGKLPWYLYGGSYFKLSATRGCGPTSVD